jgi:hypothetical protein
MKLIKFNLDKGSVYISIDKIVSVSENHDGKTEITTVNPNEFYVLDESIGNVLMTLSAPGFKVYQN